LKASPDDWIRGEKLARAFVPVREIRAETPVTPAGATIPVPSSMSSAAGTQMTFFPEDQDANK
jgi:hypothetical protein